MEAGYKNLILIDNSTSVGEANFMLCKETARYICNNLNEQDTVRIATFGEVIEYKTDYTSDKVMLSNSIDGLELTERETYITDNLVTILKEWKEQDVACRNIILFTDGDEMESLLHADEELYYMLEGSDYPVYVVQSVDRLGIPATRNLSAIATISGGKLLLTEFEGSDAASEKTMGSEILEAIDNVRKQRVEETAEEAENLEDAESETGSEAGSMNVSDTGEADDKEVNDDESLAVYSEEDMGDMYEQETVPVSTAMTAAETSMPIIRHSSEKVPHIGIGIIFPILGFVFAVMFAVIIRVITVKGRKSHERPLRFKGGFDEELKREAMIAMDAEDYDCSTMKLGQAAGRTRILDQGMSGHDIVLEDCNDPTRLFRASSDDTLVVGRSSGLCDVTIDYDDSISGRHCELSVKDGCWYVRDLNSSNGTRVNGQKVFQELMLKCGDILMLGQSSLQVRI